MARHKKKEPTDGEYAAAYWKVYYGVLGKETGKVLKTLMAPSTEEEQEPDWVLMDDALRERIGWVADMIRDKAAKLARGEAEGVRDTNENHEREQRRARK